jgi:hypothetical protein
MANPLEKEIHRLKGAIPNKLKTGDSHFWDGLMYAKKYFFRHGSFLIKDGSEIRFWEDS